MKFLKYLALTAALAVSFLTASAQITTVNWSKSVKQLSETQYEVVFTGVIAKGWHTYDLNSDDSSTTVTIETSDGLRLDGDPYEITKSKREFDDVFRVEMGYYYDKMVIAQKVTLTGNVGVLKGNINWRACEEYNCNSPEDWYFTVEIDNPKKAAAAADKKPTDVVEEPKTTEAVDAEVTANTDAAATEAVTPAETTPATVTTAPAAAEGEHKSLWSIIIEAIIWGFAALITPCVFPMVPMTVSFFMKGSATPAAGRMKAITYGLSIILLYTLPIAIIILSTRIFGGDAVTADIFNWLSTHWVPNIIFFIVFMVFAASFFGAFEITMPNWLVNKSDRNADKGGLIGIFFMALTLVLVSFSCTGPIVGMVLIKSTAGEFWEPIVTMLAFSTAFALPFTLFAMFPSLLKNLPKSGGWLNSVKVVLGFIEVAFGFKFLSMADQTYHWGLLNRDTYLAIWIVCFAMIGFYLLGKLRFAHDDEQKHITVPRLALSIVAFSFVVYMIPGMWGAPLKMLSGYLPPMHTQQYVAGGGSSTVAVAEKTDANIKYADFLHLPHGLTGYFDLAQAEEAAKAAGKPLFVDVTGHGCVNCREMEVRVWSDPQVLEILRKDYIIVALYTDDKKRVDEQDWYTTENGDVLKDLGRINSYIARTRFNVNAQPNYIILDNNGQMLSEPQAYNLDIQVFIDFLKKGVEDYKAQK